MSEKLKTVKFICFCCCFCCFCCFFRGGGGRVEFGHGKKRKLNSTM